jgi:PIN domain nuclease of toxin-antitoxin system
VIYLDTHVVAWLYAGELGRLSQFASERIEAEDVLISPMVVLELTYLHEIERLPELPGCMAAGKTYYDALANAEQIIQEWIETAEEQGRAIPNPKGRLAYA